MTAEYAEIAEKTRREDRATIRGTGSRALLVEKALTRDVIGAAMSVHRGLGPGLLESAYELCLAHDLSKRGRHVQRQIEVPVVYDGRELGRAFRVDLVVDDQVIVEIKSVAALTAVHEAQLLTYLRLTGKPVGLMINFNVTQIKDGIVRRVLTSAASTSPLRASPRSPRTPR